MTAGASLAANPWSRIAALIERFGACAMISVLSVEGSAPREAGTRMLVAPDGSYSGTIGGGTLEFEAIRAAVRALAEAGAGRLHLRTFTLGPDLGQCCGGRVTVATETFAAERAAEVGRLARLCEAGPVASEASISADGAVGARRVLPHEGGDGRPGAELCGGTLRETFADGRTPLLLFGAGHVGKALVLALAPLPFQVFLVDGRPDIFPTYLPANARPLAVADPLQAFGGIPHQSEVLIMTHDHGLDLAIADAALRLEQVSGVGMIGSETKAARMRTRLRAAGHGEEALARFRCPIGLAGISSKAPAVIAAGVAADLLVRRDVAMARWADGTTPDAGRGNARMRAV
jgi:xanthine dehydrogenase accessory factor